MRNTFSFLLFLLSTILFAQDFENVNTDLNLTDSLTKQIEIRIYRDRGTTNYTSVFRMYKDEDDKWKAEFYDHFAVAYKNPEMKFYKTEIKSKSDMELVYLNLLRSHINNLPSLNDISWKLGKRANIEKVKTMRRGQEIEEYQFLGGKSSRLLDSRGYHVEVKSWKTNSFRFSNPDYYLKQNPEVDELIYMKEIIDIIKNEFGIWKD